MELWCSKYLLKKEIAYRLSPKGPDVPEVSVVKVGGNEASKAVTPDCFESAITLEIQVKSSLGEPTMIEILACVLQ